MNEFECRKNPVYVIRDAGYSKIESISPKNRKNAKRMLENNDVISRIDLLNDLYSKIDITVYPERMSNWYAYTK